MIFRRPCELYCGKLFGLGDFSAHRRPMHKKQLAFALLLGIIVGFFVGAERPRSEAPGTFQFAFGRLPGMNAGTPEAVPVMLDTRSGKLFYLQALSVGSEVSAKWIEV